MNQILAHNPAYDPVFFTTRFVDDLKEDIRGMILLHRPKDLDTAYSLATLQEGNHMTPRARSSKGDHELAWRPRTQPQPNLQPRPAAEGSGDRRGLEGVRAVERRAPEDQLTTLRAYRRARGLCYKCGERWVQGHRCAPTVQLHIVEELLEMLQEGDGGAQEAHQDDSEEETLMSISKLVTEGGEGPKTLRLCGLIEDQEVLVLVDSGSSHSFISVHLADRLKMKKTPIPAISVRVADG